MLNRLNTEGGKSFEELRVCEAAGWGDENMHLESVFSMLEQEVDGWGNNILHPADKLLPAPVRKYIPICQIYLTIRTDRQISGQLAIDQQGTLTP